MAFPPPPSTEQLQSMINAITDAAQGYNPSPGPEGLPSRTKLITLAKSLINELRNPMDMADVHMANAMELVALRTCLQLKALHAIPFPGSASLVEIARTTGATEALLERLLRMLVCSSFLVSPSTHVYSHTKHSYAYTLLPGPGMFYQLVYDESFLMIDNLHVYLDQKGLQEPQDQLYSPYAWKSNAEGIPIWETMALHPERLHAFQAGLAHADASIPLLGYYDFGQLDTQDPERTIMVDVGGGAGHCIAQILAAYPSLKDKASKFVLQEVPTVLKKAAENADLLPEVIRMQHDFWTEQPVKGAKAYFLRRVLHDYSDMFASRILSNIVPAMAHDSRILIADLMVPEDITTNEVGIATFDITMLNMGGKERTEANFRQLLQDVGCELVRIWRSEAGFGVIVEARLRGTAERVVDGPVLADAGARAEQSGGADELVEAEDAHREIGEAHGVRIDAEGGGDVKLADGLVNGPRPHVDEAVANGSNGFDGTRTGEDSGRDGGSA